MTLYRRKYLCICAGLQAELYLNRLAYLIKDYPRRVVTFNTVIDNPCKLKKFYQDYDKAALFDFDFNDAEFQKNIELCDQINRENKPAKRNKERNTYHAYSNVNFDLWLILHKEDFFRSVSRNNAYVADVRRIYGLTSSENIKRESTIKKVLGQIDLEDVKNAINRAERIKEGKIDTDKIIVGSTECYPNPDFSIQEFIKYVLKDCGEL